jgi:GT2 family glycosyltransferase
MLVRRSAFFEVGGFDEGYWMYWEDADLCRRLTDRGWSVRYEPRAVVHHATGASGTNERTIRAFHESAARFASRHIARNALQRRLINALLHARTRLVLGAWSLRGSRS